MTLDEALTLREGDHVVSRLSSSLRPRRITKLWINQKRTIVRAYLHSLQRSGWIDSEGLEMTPKGHIWNKAMNRWDALPGERSA